MSDTPRTDKFQDKVLEGWNDWPNFTRTLERENNQLRADLKQCAAVAVMLVEKVESGRARSRETYTLAKNAISLPSVQAALKEK